MINLFYAADYVSYILRIVLQTYSVGQKVLSLWRIRGS